MENFDINFLDFKTLRLLVAISETGSVSQAAERRGMTQSTASYGLEKLRQAFSDPLFIRAGRGVVATTRGAEIVVECQQILDRLDQLASTNRFDPTTAQRDFVIAAAAFEIETILVPLRRQLATLSPHSRLIVQALDIGNIVARLDRDCDIALMSNVVESPLLKRTLLFDDQFVTFYDPQARSAPKTLDAFCRAPHVLVTLGGGMSSAVDAELTKIRRKRRVALVVDHLAAVAPMMQGSDLIITLPGRIGPGLMRDFAQVPCPVSMPPLPIYSHWHARKHTDPGHRWLRQLVADVARDRRTD